LLLAAFLTLVGVATTSSAQAIFKPPDLGPFWEPLNANGGSYVYADSFIAPAVNGPPSRLGVWLVSQGLPGSTLRLEIWGELGGGGPDPGNVLASTGSIGPFSPAALTLFEAPIATSSGPLTPGTRYFFVATVVGEVAGEGPYQVGGHTQNSVHPDNGTFWASNDPTGVAFSAQNATPEMAYSIRFPPMPAPALGSTAMIALVILLVAVARTALQRAGSRGNARTGVN